MEKRPIGVYVHYPFCLRKCLYCDFVSAPGTAREQEAYQLALQEEIRSFAPLAENYAVKSVFFGGGTPSAVPEENLAKVLELLRSEYEFLPDAEITAEANPGTLSPEKLSAYREMGIGRLSLGLQSVHDDELRLLGRIHSYAEFRENYEAARAAGFTNINIDLMSGLPNQTPELWADTLQTAAALEPEHISAYSLIIEPGTPFARLYGGMPGASLLPNEEAEREMYRYTGAFLAEKGYKRYEISNYAREGFESRHNLIYWTGGDYIGFGQNAASFVGGKRFSAPADRKGYLCYAPNAFSAYEEASLLSRKERMEEFMFLGLRLSRGVSRETFRKRFGISFPARYERVIGDMRQKGLMASEGDRVFLTEKGIDVSNRILAEFLLEDTEEEQ